MKRRILIVAFAALFCVGIVMALNREPSVEAGVLSVVCGKTETPINGTEVGSMHNGKKEEKSQDFDVAEISSSCKSFEQTVEKNTGSQDVTRNTNMSVAFQGRYCDDIKYSVYDTSGKVINEDKASLNLPTKDIDSCVVKVDVKWGREKNYREFVYFFRVNFEKTK